MLGLVDIVLHDKLTKKTGVGFWELGAFNDAKHVYDCHPQPETRD